MTLEEIINHHRSTYINQLISFYGNRSNGAKEILLKLSSDEETLLFNLTRPDFLSNNDGNYGIEELYPDTFSNHEPINFVYKNLNIELHPIFWHGVEFILDTKLPPSTVNEGGLFVYFIALLKRSNKSATVSRNQPFCKTNIVALQKVNRS